MARLQQGERIVEVLKQDKNAPVAVELQVAIIYAVVNDLLREIPVADIRRFEEELFDYLTATQEELLSFIRTTGTLDDEHTQKLREVILSVKANFLGAE